MDWRAWLARRGPRYVLERAAALLNRYGLTPQRAEARTLDCVAMLAEHGCPPTLPVPGRVVDRHPDTIRRLQAAGAEIAVHSYDHIDLSTCPPDRAVSQLIRAVETFERQRIAVHGFRCPYLGCTDALLDALPAGLFDYSSNRAVWWDILPEAEPGRTTAVYETLSGFYRPLSARDSVCTPWWRDDLVEIPVSAPDDLQIYDGLQMGAEGLAQAWRRILEETAARGELFVLLFHPELATEAREPFIDVLDRAADLQPIVWRARLSDVSAWWREKAGFRADFAESDGVLRFSLDCSQRATVLVRGLDHDLSVEPWSGAYFRVRDTSFAVPPGLRPLVGVAGDVPPSIVAFLRNQGYILDTGPVAARCGVYLEAATLRSLSTERALVDYIETADAPLVRFGRWPDGAGSAMCVTGDLDALTLLDYLSRLSA